MANGNEQLDTQKSQFGFVVLLSLSLPAFVSGFMHAPASAFLQGVYAQHAGLALTAIGGVVLLTRVFDAVTDPLVGFWSDRMHRKSGTRKPIVAVGLIFALIGLWQLFTPPENPTIFYFGAWFAVTFLGWTLADIPLRAWSVELTSDYKERSRIQSWLAAAMLAGTMIFFLVPYAAAYSGLTESSEVNFDTLFLVAVVLVVFTPLAILLSVTVVPDGAVLDQEPGDGAKEIWRSVVGNRPFLYFTAMFLMVAIASGINQGALYFYIANYLGLATALAGLFAMAIPIMVISVPVWGKLAATFDRRKVWAVAIAATAVGYALLGTIEPGESSFFKLVAVFSLIYFAFGSTMVIAPALLGDVADYGRAKFGKNRSGVYFSLYLLAQKTTAGVGVALGLVVLSMFGFDATAGEQTEQALFGVKFTVSIFPCLALLITAPVIWHFPISKSVQHELAADLGASIDESKVGTP